VTRAVTLSTDDGVTIDAEASLVDGAVRGVVLCHPHPTYGGDMHAGVVETLFRELPGHGLSVLRFDFRGVGRSSGSFGGGVGEQRDVLAAVAWLARAVGAPVVTCGWSFGGDVSLAVGPPDLAGWCAVAPVLDVVPPGEMAAGRDPRPTLLLLAEHDQFRPPAEAEALVAGWQATETQILAGTDHFLWGRHDEIVEAVAGFSRSGS